MPGRCKYYRWQRVYLADLVDFNIVEIHGGGNGGGDGDEAVSGMGSRSSVEEKLEYLIRLMKKLVVLLALVVVVGIVLMFK